MMAARRSLARSIPALRSIPRTPVARAVNTQSLSTAASITRISTQRIVSTFGTMSTTRRLHATTQQLGPATTPTAIEYPTDHQPIANPVDTANFLNNEFVPSKATTWIDLHDPATNNLVTRVPQSTDEELKAAVQSAEKAFPAWRATSIIAKQQIIFKFTNLIREHWDRLAASITLEQGKTFADAKGDVLRGLQVAETACGITTQMTGEVLEVAKDMETRSYREPLGVVAAICPFSKFTTQK